MSGLCEIYTNLRLSLICKSTKSLSAQSFQQSISFSSWESDLAATEEPALSPRAIIEFLATVPGKCILVDNTSNQDVANAYPSFLKNGISIVTPNKKAFSGSLDLWNDIFSSAYSPSNPARGLVYHESSVCAGLPLLSTLKDLVLTGDKVTRIEGIFSGTMSFLFNSFAPVEGEGGQWSSEVQKAKEAGYTEPDPRDDLNGLDVARKLVILARLAGLNVADTGSFPVKSLIPAELEHAQSADDFMRQLPQFDDNMARIKDGGKSEGKVVRYVGMVDFQEAKVRVGLENFDKSHPIATLKGSDNIINIHTRRYGANPLIIQGAG